MPMGCEVLGRAVASRLRRGLYGGKQVLFGNTISEDGGNKTRRRWKPNAQYKKLYSEALDEMIRLRVTTHVIKCVDKVGGLDKYLLRQSDAALKSETDVGYNLKKRIQAAIALQKKEAHASSVASSA